MDIDVIHPKKAPRLFIPEKGKTCSLSIIDTTCNLTVPADTLVEPTIHGHELMNFPTVSFLITHSGSRKHVLFDLGCRKDFWNLPPPIAETIFQKVPGIKVDKNLVEILEEGAFDFSRLDAAIISHHHYDHFGDPSHFPKSMSLVVGPGFSGNFLPGYPTVEAAPAFEDAFEGRKVWELAFTDDFIIAGYRAVDYFTDGSLYILDTPGHAIGHLSALVRTSENKFVFLGGDICHFGGSFRPTEYLPMPAQFNWDQAHRADNQRNPCVCSCFTNLHPDPSKARISPFYKPSTREDSWYIDPLAASRSIRQLAELDAQDQVLVLITHDPAIMNILPFFPNGNLDNWHIEDWKEVVRWKFLQELPEDGNSKPSLVDGTYIHGKRVKQLNGVREGA